MTFNNDEPLIKDGFKNKTDTTKFPRLKPPCQNYSRARNGRVGREEWLSINEYTISDVWEVLKSCIERTNTTLLDNCTYVDFSAFVAQYSTYFSD